MSGDTYAGALLAGVSGRSLEPYHYSQTRHTVLNLVFDLVLILVLALVLVL